MAVSRSIWQNIQQYRWLILALGCTCTALICWLMINPDDLVEVKQPEKVETQIESEQVTATPHLGALVDKVKPLDLTERTVSVNNTHAPEFRGTQFIENHLKQWTVEVFRSRKEEIITHFLLGRTDRDQFTYFRLSAPEQVEQYVLAYGTFSSVKEAQQKFAQLKLVLPSSIQPVVRQFKYYHDAVKDLGSDELHSSDNRLYAVKLKPAALPRVDESLLQFGNQQKDSMPTTKTTITQHDEQGNVVNVQKSQSTTQPKAVVNEPNKVENSQKSPARTAPKSSPDEIEKMIESLD